MTAAATPLRVLLVEDSPLDARLIERQLRRAGYAPEPRRVTSETDLREALACFEKAIHLDPSMSHSFECRTMILSHRGDLASGQQVSGLGAVTRLGPSAAPGESLCLPA